METGKKRMITTFRVRFLIVIGVLLAFGISGEAQEKKGTIKGGERGTPMGKPFGLMSSRSPIDLASDTVEASQKQNSVTFKGNVVAKQEDITLYANMLVIYYDPDAKAVKQVVASGNVKIVQLERRATGQKVTFKQEENQVQLEGNAVLREGENVIRGDRVTCYVDEDRCVVEGGKGGRVNTSITPPKKEP
jgi:lipopolysaccharide export system protein LptA